MTADHGCPDSFNEELFSLPGKPQRRPACGIGARGTAPETAEKKKVLDRTFLDMAIGPLLQAHQSMFQEILIGVPADHRHLSEMEKPRVLRMGIDEHCTRQRIRSEAVCDLGSDGIKHRLARMEPDDG
ncbi:hypothetical protein P7L87_27220, partial [Vibrio parahaemolyticus]|nr:hypothetical protein [Vibrio parahaemolyticus]